MRWALPSSFAAYSLEVTNGRLRLAHNGRGGGYGRGVGRRRVRCALAGVQSQPAQLGPHGEPFLLTEVLQRLRRFYSGPALFGSFTLRQCIQDFRSRRAATVLLDDLAKEDYALPVDQER